MRSRSVSERVADRRFLDELVAAVPEFQAGYDEHLQDYDGDALAHLFFATDVWPWFIGQYNAQTAEAKESYARLYCAPSTSSPRASTRPRTSSRCRSSRT